MLSYSSQNGKSQEVIYLEKKKIGRPTDARKSHRESFRFSEEDMEKIKFCMEKTGESKTAILRMGINHIYNALHE